MERLDNLLKGKLSVDKKISVESLILWESAISTRVDKKTSNFKTSVKLFKSNSLLK